MILLPVVPVYRKLIAKFDFYLTFHFFRFTRSTRVTVSFKIKMNIYILFVENEFKYIGNVRFH